MSRKVKKEAHNDVHTVVIKALDSPIFKYRTVSGLAKETHLTVEVVKKVLESDKNVRKSLVKSKTGAELYTAKKRVSPIADAWNAFRALNSAKFGG